MLTALGCHAGGRHGRGAGPELDQVMGGHRRLEATNAEASAHLQCDVKRPGQTKNYHADESRLLEGFYKQGISSLRD